MSNLYTVRCWLYGIAQVNPVSQNQDSDTTLIIILICVVSLSTIFLVMFLVSTIRMKKVTNGLLKHELKNQMRRLKKAFNDYDTLVYRTSHDIRGPIATLIGLTEIARQTEPSEVQKVIAQIQNIGLGLERRVSKLLVVSSVNNIELNHVRIDFESIVKESITSLKRSYSHHTIRTSFTSLLREPFYSDPNLITLIISSILENSFRFVNTTIGSSFISIVVCHAETDNTKSSLNKGKIIIRVTDNGLGVPEEVESRLFELFFVASEQHGDGLGLFLAQRSAHRLGGQIRLRKNSNPTIFEAVIPYEPHFSVTV